MDHPDDPIPQEKEGTDHHIGKGIQFEPETPAPMPEWWRTLYEDTDLGSPLAFHFCD